MEKEMQRVINGNPRNELATNEQPTNEGPRAKEVRQPRVEEESNKGKIS